MLKDKTAPRYDDYSFFVYGLIRQLHCRSVFEVGLGPYGNTAKAILTAFKENEEILGDGYNPRYTVVDLEPTEYALEVLESFDKKYWELRVGDSANSTLFQQVGIQSDLALIDGCHTTQYCFNDLANLLAYNNFDTFNGLVVFHDTRMPTVAVAIQKLKETFNLDVFYLPQNSSIALAKIKGS